MSEGNVIDAEEAAVVARLTKQPVVYKVEIRHFASEGRWLSGFSIHDIGEMDAHNRESIIADLRWCANMLEAGVQMVCKTEEPKPKAFSRPRFEVIQGEKPAKQPGDGVLPRSGLSVRLVDGENSDVS